MQNLNNQIQFWKLKTFNEKLNACIGFLRIHWKPLLKANLVIAGPLFILGIGLILFYFQVFVQKIVFDPENESMILKLFMQSFLYIFVGGLLYGISLLSVSIVTFEYVKLASENSDDRFNYRQIFNNGKKRFWKLLGAMILVLFAYMGASFAVGIGSLLVAFIPFLGVILVILIRLGLQLLFYGMLYIYMPMSYFERQPNSRLFSKARDYLSRDFWQTSGMVVGSKLIQTILANGILIPLISFLFFKAVRQIEDSGITAQELFKEERYIFVLFMLMMFLYLLLNTATNIFHIINSAIQYFSLKEKNEGTYMYSQIENFENLTVESKF